MSSNQTKNISARICLRKDTKNNWTSVAGGNVVLSDGEVAIVVDTSNNTVNFKIGDGETIFSSLPYISFSELNAQKVNFSQLNGLTYNLNNIADCIKLCGTLGRIMGANVIMPDDVENGMSIALMKNINPTDNTTYGDLESTAQLSDTDTLSELI